LFSYFLFGVRLALGETRIVSGLQCFIRMHLGRSEIIPSSLLSPLRFVSCLSSSDKIKSVSVLVIVLWLVRDSPAPYLQPVFLILVQAFI
jgi:hypothetical protein